MVRQDNKAGKNPNRDNQKSISVHTFIIEKLTAFLMRKQEINEKRIRVDHIEWIFGPPDLIGDFLPDITVEIGDQDYAKEIYEVETHDSYDSKHTKQQLLAFASEPDSRVILVVGFEEILHSEANRFIYRRKVENQMEQWGIGNKVKIILFDYTFGKFIL